eukprot:scaffold78739_cov69-Phaeocystis_antarctica.AAC.2
MAQSAGPRKLVLSMASTTKVITKESVTHSTHRSMTNCRPLTASMTDGVGKAKMHTFVIIERNLTTKTMRWTQRVSKAREGTTFCFTNVMCSRLDSCIAAHAPQACVSMCPNCEHVGTIHIIMAPRAPKSVQVSPISPAQSKLERCVSPVSRNCSGRTDARKLILMLVPSALDSQSCRSDAVRFGIHLDFDNHRRRLFVRELSETHTN